MKKTQLTKVIKAVVNKNTVMPILENVVFDNDRIEVSDLENFVSIPYQSGIKACVNASKFLTCIDMMDNPTFDFDGIKKVTISEGKKKVGLVSDKVKDFPIFDFSKPYYQDENINEIHEVGFLDVKAMSYIETALKFTSNDDLRPAMTGIYINDEIVGTDAHRLFHAKIEPFAVPFILPGKTAKILLTIGGEWQVFANQYQAIFINEDLVSVSCRVIDAKFPNYKVVIPTDEGNMEWKQDIKELRSEIKSALKFANTSTNQVTFSLNGKAIISSQDVDFAYEYSSELENFKLNKIHKEDLTIAFNGNFLTEILGECEGKEANIRLWDHNKAALIGENFLLMPLMLNS